MQENKNRNNQVHNKNQSGKIEFVIEKLLPIGQENAISTADLVRLAGCSSSRELQHRIAAERAQGAIICSGTGKGYWKPKDKEEIVQFVRTMDARARNTLRATRSAKEALRKGEMKEGVENK